MMRSLLIAGLLAATAVPVAAQDYYGSGYDDRAGSDERRDIRATADFEAPLARYGRWVPSRFGRAWTPNVARDWRPYTLGHWVDTEDGQTWDSDEPWGWATYHYGRWGFDDRYGWVWVPDTEWAPAWVAWRDGDDYAGWAPLPPQGVYGAGYGDWDYDRWYAPSWIYVQRSNLYRRDVGRTVLPWRGNRGYWDRTRQQQHGWTGRDGRDGRRDWSDGHRAGQTGRDWSGGRRGGDNDRRGGVTGANRAPPRNGAQFDNRPTRPDGTAVIVPPGAGRPGGWNGDARGTRWDGGARPHAADGRDGRDGRDGGRGDDNRRDDSRRDGGRDRGQATAPGSGVRPSQWQGRPDPVRGREGAPIAPVQNAGRDRPAAPPQAQPQPRPVQAQPQPRPEAAPQPRPEAAPGARPQQPRGDRPARDNPRRERGDKQPD